VNLLAHSGNENKPPQFYKDHIAGVVNAACNNVESLFPFINENRRKLYYAVVSNAACFHDLGKLNQRNQNILLGKEKSDHLYLDHRDAGVAALLGGNFEIPAATLVYAHHRPGLPNIMEEKIKQNPFRFLEAIKDSNLHLDEYVELHRKELGNSFNGKSCAQTQRLSAMEYRILLSCLVDADYSDSAGEHPFIIHPRWDERLERLDDYVKNLQKNSVTPNSERNRLRKEFYDYCELASTDNLLEYCDSPVGTGKTTAIMAHMLKSASAKGLRHIFVVLPYTNIISQTVKILRKALVLEGEDPAEIVAEHHHQADFENYELRKLATSWKAPIIVTTAVQFFETLAGSIPSKLRKLNQLPGSGIILDEYHAVLPTHLMLPAWRWVTELSEQWNCHFCFCSGTSLKFWESQPFKVISSAKVVSLLSPEMEERLTKFEEGRISLSARNNYVPHFNGVDNLIDFLCAFPGSKLVVLNTVKSAAYLAKRMKERGKEILHLSTALTPKDREAVITQVKQRLNSAVDSGDWTLIATSCVECGMDFSFRNGFCELRSLTSYLQLGGRINRNNEYQNASLIAFTIQENNFGNNPAFDISRQVFSELIDSYQFSSLPTTQSVTQCFNNEWKKSGSLSDSICKMERNLAFFDVATNFRVINEKTTTVVADPELVNKIKNKLYVSATELQRGSINVRDSVIKKLGINNSELPSLSIQQYDSFLGYMKTLV
jgi:CRISPR-associated endonuclease/helicase Cas3